MKSRNQTYLILLLPITAYYLWIFVWPLLQMFWLSISAEPGLSIHQYQTFFGNDYYTGILLRTLRLSVLVTLLTCVLGYPIAIYLSQPGRKHKALVTFLVIAPLMVSAVVRGYGWIIILGPSGLLNRLTGLLHLDWGALLYTETAIVIALTQVFLPFMVLSLAGVLQKIDPDLGRAAAILGASDVTIFRRVTLPLSLPGIAAGSVLVFCLTASSFVTPTLVGGASIPVMTYLVYNQGLLLFDWPLASAIGVILLLTTAAVITTYNVLLGPRLRSLS